MAWQGNVLGEMEIQGRNGLEWSGPPRTLGCWRRPQVPRGGEKGHRVTPLVRLPWDIGLEGEGRRRAGGFNLPVHALLRVR